jgi:EAL domain-containing protein (putative c-di-GMP-specific phosphodiesterase class I)
MAFISDLRLLGCRFALDDFGTSLSSFAYLKNFPVDYIKIDGAFVKNLNIDPANRAVVEMITHVGHVMGKQVIAECVESETLIKTLRDAGVDFGQGMPSRDPSPLKRFLDRPAAAVSKPQAG